jgi:hypothetical protein
LDYLHEVEHMGDRIGRLEQAIAEAVKLAPPRMQEVIQQCTFVAGSHLYDSFIHYTSPVYPAHKAHNP